VAKVIEPTQALDVEDLKTISRELRVDIIQMITEAGSGHPGGSLSAIDALVCLYFGGILRYNPSEPAWPERDRFVLSKGHCSPALYTVLARAVRAFRWHAIDVDGHDHGAVLEAMREAIETTGKPTAIVSRTVKGKGVSWMELNPDWHGKAPNAEQAEEAIAEIMRGAR
jgi:transketolase